MRAPLSRKPFGDSVCEIRITNKRSRCSRKALVTGIILALGASLAPAEAQQAARIPRVGFLSPVGRSSPVFGIFRQGLAELGYVEGQNIVIEPRFAEGQYERLPEMSAELARLKVDLIAVVGAVTARAVKGTITNIPICFAVQLDPVEDHVVASLEHPGGNMTGASSFDPQQPRRQLELLKQTIPGLSRVALLGDQGVRDVLIKANEEQAQALGLQTQRLRLTGASPDLQTAFTEIQRERADAVLALEEPIVGKYAKEIAGLAAHYRIPTMFSPTRADDGGMMAYGTSLAEATRRIATCADKVLKGAKPGELPVEKVTRYELIVNLKTAREIGITIPPEVLKRADRVIQ